MPPRPVAKSACRPPAPPEAPVSPHRIKFVAEIPSCDI
jgi:hypothetical protein